MGKIESEIGQIKSNQTNLLKTMDHTPSAEEQQAKLAKSLEKPTAMLAELRHELERMM